MAHDVAVENGHRHMTWLWRMGTRMSLSMHSLQTLRKSLTESEARQLGVCVCCCPCAVTPEPENAPAVSDTAAVDPRKKGEGGG